MRAATAASSLSSLVPRVPSAAEPLEVLLDRLLLVVVRIPVVVVRSSFMTGIALAD